ncbi:MAG TPA: DNA replication/repair protein RecF [bacterium]|nr:DNA replication/repair protein RecF [bacterium]
MYASQIYLNNFRNYREATVTAPPGLILVVGPNGAGKTNLLEAVHFLALGRSFRTSRDRDLVRRGEDTLSVRATVHSDCGEQHFALDYGAAGKVAAVNDETIPRLIDYVGTLAVVAFGPDDLALAKGEPAVRRRFLDVWLGQESREYLYTLQRYYAVLRSRNALLSRAAPRAEMEPYDHELVAAGARLTSIRAGAAAGLAAAAATAYGELAPEDEDFVVDYDPAVPCDGDEEEVARAFERKLRDNRADEERRRQTLVGPHRDDLRLTVTGCDARRFASEGQQRTAALSLRVAQFRLLKKTRGDAPLLLLDDVASELDAHRQRRLADVVTGAEQVFFTATDPPAGIEPDANIRITEGQIATSD